MEQKKLISLGMMVYVYDLSSQKPEAGGSRIKGLGWVRWLSK